MFLLFDIGRTKFRLARSEDGESLDEPEIIPTPKLAEEGIELIIKAVRNSDKTVKAIVIGSSRKVWGGALIAELVKREIDLPVYTENDAALAALGEAGAGAGRGARIVGFLTVSSGVGGARVVNQKIDLSTNGFEPGEQILSVDQTGVAKTLEELVSGLAVEAKFGKKPFEINDSEHWLTTARWLARGLHNSIIHWSPDVFVLGGSMFKSPGIDLKIVGKELALIPTVLPKLPPLRRAWLGEASALRGGLLYLRTRGL